MTPVRAVREPVIWLVMSLASVATFAADSPQQWLDRMNAALTTRNYDGVFSHWQSGRLETLRIVHRVLDGAVTERLESLDGTGRQFVRNGAELTCYLPDQRTVLVEKPPTACCRRDCRNSTPPWPASTSWTVWAPCCRWARRRR